METKKSANFSEAEKVLLTELVEQNLSVVNSKFKSGINNQLTQEKSLGGHCSPTQCSRRGTEDPPIDKRYMQDILWGLDFQFAITQHVG